MGKSPESVAQDTTPFSLTMEVEEDIEQEIENFVRFKRRGEYLQAQELFQQSLSSHLALFPVIAEYADLLLEQGKFRTLSEFLDIQLQYMESMLEEQEVELLRIMRSLVGIYTIGALRPALEQARDTWNFLRRQRSKVPPGTLPSDVEIHIFEVYIKIFVFAMTTSNWVGINDMQCPWTRDSRGRCGFVQWYALLLENGQLWNASNILVILLKLLPSLEVQDVAILFRAQCFDDVRKSKRLVERSETENLLIFTISFNRAQALLDLALGIDRDRDDYDENDEISGMFYGIALSHHLLAGDLVEIIFGDGPLGLGHARYTIQRMVFEQASKVFHKKPPSKSLTVGLQHFSQDLLRQDMQCYIISQLRLLFDRLTISSNPYISYDLKTFLDIQLHTQGDFTGFIRTCDLCYTLPLCDLPTVATCLSRKASLSSEIDSCLLHIDSASQISALWQSMPVFSKMLGAKTDLAIQKTSRTFDIPLYQWAIHRSSRDLNSMLRERGMREKRPLLYDEVSLRKIKENLPVTRWNLKRISMFAESISDKQPAPEEEPKAPISIVHPPQNNLSHANIPSHLLSQNILTMSPGLLGSPLPATQFPYDAGSMERRALMSSESREKFLGNSRLITPSDGYNPFQPEPWTATSESKFHAEQNRAGNPFGASMEKLTIATPPKIEENHHMQAKDLVNSAAIHQLSDPDTNDETEREHSSDIPPDIPSPGSKSKKSDTGSRISNILSSKGKEKKAMPRDSPGFLVRTLDTAARRAGDNGFFSKDTPQGLRPLKDDYLERIQKEDSFRWQTKRFEALGEGIHRHCLREIRRQELLPPLLPKTTSGGNKKSNYDLEQLIPSFARIEDDILAVSDSLGKAASGDPLFEKYGELNEFITHNKTRCVRIAHKIDPCGFGVEILYVVKQGWDNSRETRKRYQKRLTSEFRISSALNHPNVLRSLDLLQDSRGVYSMVTKYCAAGNLHTLISTTGELESGESDCFFKQLVCGLRYIHEMGVAHRDLNPENLLLTTEGTLKIASFGSSESFRVSNGEEVRLSSGLCGSGPYIAPEEYTEKEFSSSAADIWATGLIYMAMRTGQSLWKVSGQDDRLFRQYTKNRRYSEGYPPIETLHQTPCRNVIYAILDPNPSRRITASQILKSEWIYQVKLCVASLEGF